MEIFWAKKNTPSLRYYLINGTIAPRKVAVNIWKAGCSSAAADCGISFLDPGTPPFMAGKSMIVVDNLDSRVYNFDMGGFWHHNNPGVARDNPIINDGHLARFEGIERWLAKTYGHACPY